MIITLFTPASKLRIILIKAVAIARKNSRPFEHYIS